MRNINYEIHDYIGHCIRNELICGPSLCGSCVIEFVCRFWFHIQHIHLDWQSRIAVWIEENVQEEDLNQTRKSQ